MKGALVMKRKILVLGVMLSCLLCFTGCGEQQQVAQNNIDANRFSPEAYNEESLGELVKVIEDNYFESWYLDGVTPENFEEKLYLKIGANVPDDSMYDTFSKGYESWFKAVDEIGYNSIDSFADDISVKGVTYDMDNKKGLLVVTGKLQGTKHAADMVIYMDNRANLTDIGVTADKTVAEKLENAGLNTLLGMGMAFSILILISLIISLFPVLFGEKKKKSNKAITEKAIDNTVNQIAEQEDLSSDAELVAVIAAAIAAYEGSGSTDGFRVRSIRKVNNNWKRF